MYLNTDGTLRGYEEYGLGWNPFKAIASVVTAPFKLGAKVVKKVVKVVPSAVGGFLTGGLPGAAIATAGKVFGGGGASTDIYATSPPDASAAAASALSILKAAAARRVAQTPEGQAVLRKEAVKASLPLAVPLLLGIGLLVLSQQRRR
jgi:hypothetical protein